MALTLITAPTMEPVSLEEVKWHLRVSSSDKDGLIAIYIRAAREYLDGASGFLGRALVTQTWQLALDEFPTNEIKIPLPPLRSVGSVVYDTVDGEVTIGSDNYYVDTDSEPGWVVPVASFDWPTPIEAVNAVRITFDAGYPPDTGSSPVDYAANVPFNIKAAMLLMIADWMENREETRGEPISNNITHSGADRLLRRHKIDKGIA